MNFCKSLLLKFSSLLFFFLICFDYSYAQTDTIVINNQKIACSVKEITPEAVNYTYPGEDVINSVYKNTVQKIVFKNGRVQTFAEATSYKLISSPMDFDKVTITSVESEVKGLFKISDVSSKAKGTTVYSNQEKVKDRAYKKIKIQAAMFGANIIYLTAQRTEGNKYGTYFTSGSTTETNLTGIAYSNILPDYDAFKKLIGSRTNLVAVRRFELDASDSDISQDDDVNKSLVITNIENENGIIFIEGKLEGESDVNKFQLSNFTKDSFSIAYKYKGDAYNFVIPLSDNKPATTINISE